MIHMCGKFSKDETSRYDSLVWLFSLSQHFDIFRINAVVGDNVTPRASHRVFELITILSIADIHEVHES